MAKKIVTSNIQTNHTLGEYQRYFAHLLKKGKLHRYELSEKEKLNPNRQYWKITDEHGKTYYYEVPKYIKPDYAKSAYSMKRVMHRRPARAALAIFAGTALLSFTSAIVTRNIFATHFPDVPPQPVNLEGLQKKLKEFQNWQKDNPEGDATKQFTINDLANISIANALYDPDSYFEEGGKGNYLRRPLLTVGYGSTLSLSIINVNVTNSFTFDGANALEESISFCGDDPLDIAPKVGRRDFFTKTSDNDGVVHSNSGEASDPVTIKWNIEDDKPEKSKSEYEEEVGKIPDNPFLYSIDEETVLASSTANKTSDGYEINIDLDKEKGVARYVRRMTYLSGKTVDRFYSVKLNLITDNNLRLITHEVKESYDVSPGIYTVGELKTKFYYDDVPPIPDKTTPFEYSKYPKE